MSLILFTNEEASNTKLNIDELYEKKQKRELNQLETFNKILNRIHKQIKFTSKNKYMETCTWFIVPKYIVGENVYDIGECIGYLVSQLDKNGFNVKYIHPNTLFISWDNWVPSYVRNEIKKKLGIMVDEKGNIIENELDEEENSKKIDNPLDEISIKIQNLNKPQKEKKQYTSTKEYKPTGNFIYTPDILQQLVKKIEN